MLMRYPSLSDSEIGRISGLNQSTVSTINKRLRIRGAYRQLRVPMLQRLGCELLSGAFFDFNLLADIDLKRKCINEIIRNSKGLFFWILGKNQGLLLWINSNYSESVSEIENVENLFVSNRIVEKPFKRVFLPFSITRINRFFDFSEVVRQNFGIEKEISQTNEANITTYENEQVSLSPMEKKVFYGLVKYPDMIDKELGHKLGVSRHTISKMRHNFYERKLLYDLKLPSFREIGIEIIAFVYSKFKIGDTIQNRAPTTEHFLSNYPVITSIATNREAITLLALNSFSQYQEAKHYALGDYMKAGHIREEPDILLFSTKESLNGETFHLDFTRATSNFLNISL